MGSDIHGEQGVDLQADAGDISIEATQTTRSSYVRDKEVTVSLGDAAEGIDDPGAMIKTDDGRLTIKLASAHYNESDTRNNNTNMRSSNISSGGDIDINANAGSVNVVGSNLASDTDGDNSGDINLSAARNVNIVEATDTASSESKTTTGDADLSFVVQNQAVEVVKAVQQLEDAKEQLEESKRQYKDYERNLDQLEQQLAQLEKDFDNKKPGVNYDDIVELRALVDEVKDDEEWYIAGIALAATNLLSATTALMQQTAAAAASTATYGFNVGLQLDIDATKTKSEYLASTAVASNLSGQNIRIQTGSGNTEGTTTNIQGSQLQANNQLAITTGDLNVTASKNTVTTGNETEHGHITAQMTVYGAAGGASVNASFDRSKNSARETTYNNSVLLADKIDITTSGDTTLRGATVRAESELNADIAGNLTVESVQNRSSSRNTSNGISGGFSLGGDGVENKENGVTQYTQSSSDVGGMSGVNAGFSTGNGMSSTRETVLTSLTSGGTANINVGNHTQITGVLVATTDNNGNDLNQLNLSTNTLGFSDLRNSNISSQTNTAFSSNIGIGATNPGQPNTAQNNTGSELLPGTSNLTYNNSQQNNASKQLATLGHGNISVGGTVLEQNGELTEAGKAEDSAMADMNRDTANTTKELWSSDYSQDVDVTLDHRLLKEEGRNEIKQNAQDSYEFGQDIGRATQTILDSADLNVTNFWTTLTNNTIGTQIKNELTRNAEYSELLTALQSEDADVFAQAFRELGAIAQSKFGLTPDQFGDIFLYDGNATTSTSLQNRLLSDTMGGTVLDPSNPEYGNIGINTTGGKKSEMVNTLGHETIELVTLRTNSKNDVVQEAQANAFGFQFADRINQAVGGEIDSTSGSAFNVSLQNSYAVTQGTLRANTVASARVDNRALANVQGQAAINNLRAQGIEIEASDIKTRMVMGIEESSSIGEITQALAAAGQCQTGAQCRDMATGFVRETYGGPVLNELGGGLLVPSAADDPAVTREVALQFLGDNFRHLLSNNPELERNFTAQLTHPVQGVVDLREYYAIAFSYSMNLEAAKAGLIPSDFAQTAGEAVGAAAWNALHLAGRWELAGALNNCAACPQDMPQAHNQLFALMEIGSELALLRGVAAIGNAAANRVGKVASKADDVRLNDRRDDGDVVLKTTFNRYLNNTTNPDIRDAFVSKADDVRSALPVQFADKGNLALANIDVQGLPSQMKAFSQFQKGEHGFVSLSEGETILQPLSVNKYGVVDGKDSFSRIYDGEFKILEATARALGNNPSATGRIDLFTELKACTSCGGAIQQFRAMYPKIQLNIFTKK